MPAIPVAPRSDYQALQVPVPTSQGFFEDGDHLYLQTPVQKITPTDAEIEEYAFSSAVKAKAPNQNIVWFRGRYVEADRANRNGAQWSANELAIKSLTPMLMPVTVMHDPRTAVGTIADVKHLTPQRDGIARPRIDTVLALWGHRFPEAVAEAERNAEAGTLMQSMECYSPWYECSVCHTVFHKLPGGAEQAMWCEHLAASRPSGGTSRLHPPRSAARLERQSYIRRCLLHGHRPDLRFTGSARCVYGCAPGGLGEDGHGLPLRRAHCNVYTKERHEHGTRPDRAVGTGPAAQGA